MSVAEIPPSPRRLAPTAERGLAEAHGFMLLFGRIWAGVGGGLIVIFGVMAFVSPQMGVGVFIAVPFLVAGAVLIELAHRRIRRDRRLLESGRLVTGEVIENAVDRRFRKNRKYSTRITCCHHDEESARDYVAELRTWNDQLIARHPVGLELPLMVDDDSGRAIAPSLVGAEFQ